MDTRGHRLGEMTWTDIADRRGVILAMPVGSCEQHGPHLPLDTDTRIAIAVAEGLAGQRSDVLVGPAVTISASGEHAGFPGTLSFGVDVVEAMLVELGRSADWAVGVVFVNGHGGNAAAVTAAVRHLTSEGRHVLAWWPRPSESAPVDAHAGRMETSMMLAIAPELVRTEAAIAGNMTALPALMPALRAGGVAAVSPNGVLGDPSGASAGEGAQLLAALVADAVAQVDAWRR